MDNKDGIFGLNLAALKRKDPFLGTVLQTAGGVSGASVVSARSGRPTLRLACGDGREVLFHSLFDPDREAEKFIAPSVSKVPAIYIVCGFGFGYHVRSLLAAIGDESKVLVLEKSAELFACALRNVDCRDIIESGRVVFSVDDGAGLTQFKFKRLINFWAEPDVRTVALGPAMQLDGLYYEEKLAGIRDEFLVNIRNTGTLVFLSSLWQYNTLRNLESIISSPGVSEIEETRLFAGRTAIMVSAGPSLDRNIDELKRVGDRAVIISVGTALKALLRHGIRPDVVVAVDGSPKMFAQFDGLDLDGLFLVSSACLFPGIVELFRGRSFFFAGGNEILDWLSPVIGEKGALAVGGTVAVSAMDLAFRAGAENIILVGQDFAFLDDGTTHASGTMYDGVKGRQNADWRRVPGNYADEVVTDSMFYTYLKIMERLIPSYRGVRVINATAGGARIEGTELMGLGEAIDRFCAEPCEPIREKLCAMQARHFISNFDVLLMNIEEACGGLSRIQEICGRGVDLCNRLIFLSKVYYEDSRLQIEDALSRLEEIDREMLEKEEFNKLIAMTIRAACFGIGTKPRPEEERMSRAIFANRRSREFYEQIIGACVWTRSILSQIRDNLAREMERALEAVN